MRFTASEKQEIIRLVDQSDLGVNQTLKRLGIHKSTFYKWYRVYLQRGIIGLTPEKKTRRQWNSIPDEQKQLVGELALEHTALSCRSWPSRSPTSSAFLSPKAASTGS